MARFDNYKNIADGIATLFFPHAEVILHDLETQTVAHIANNISKRQLGDDSSLQELAGALESEDNPDTRFAQPIGPNFGPYEKLNWNGQKIRSISTVLKDEQGQAVAILCINLNFALLEAARDALVGFFQPGRILPQPEALFRDDWQERINTFLHSWLGTQQLSLSTLSRQHKRTLVRALFAEGAFDGRSSADYVANVLSMGRATVYKYVRELREEA
ncbi:PAS domain-containing protein [Pseudomonas sp. HR96]|uniref:helix-turn-helix transcriptional regulator n=1 Tax=Pseudomonas sp. HR96 TaxID=1027966 RepID=UPI002A75D2AF|nr:PAS domain-containing protein [Pseudomonas sp. HR96]WPP01674.1 PAS domain-containing protein [Pseudomonas sp. HR96]